MASEKYYAVSRGKHIGIFSSWGKCAELVLGYPKAKYKSFYDFEDAEDYVYDERGIWVGQNEIDKEIF